MYPEWVSNTRVSICIWYLYFFYLKNNKIISKTKQFKDGMHKTGLNAKPDCGLHDFTLQSLQYITSIIEAGNDSSEAQEPTTKAEGKGALSRQVDRILHRNWMEAGLWYDVMVQWVSDARAEERHLSFFFFLFKLTSRSDNLPCSAARQTESASSLPSIGVPTHLQPRTLTSQIWLQQIHPEPRLHNTGCLWPLLHCIHRQKRPPLTEAKASLPVICRETEATGVGRCVNKLKSEPQSLQGKPSAPHITKEKHNPRALKQLSDRASVLHINLSCSQVEVNAKYRHTHCTAGSFLLFGNYSDVFPFVGFRNHSSHNILWTPTRTKPDFPTKKKHLISPQPQKQTNIWTTLIWRQATSQSTMICKNIFPNLPFMIHIQLYNVH